MLLRGFTDALMMRAQQALAHNGAEGFCRRTTTLFGAASSRFFVAMPLVTGLMNFVVPLQIGARDVASVPEQLQLLDDASGANPGDLLFVEFGQTGWLAYPPLSGIQYSPGGC
jgi:cytochrome o ubiquinol oxidase subunit 1